MAKKVTAIRNFDVRDELRATAARRIQQTTQPYHSNTRLPVAVARAAPIVYGSDGVPEIAARLAHMFPSLSGDIVHAVLSELFRADAQITREVLADRAVTKLLEITSQDGDSLQTLTSFEPRAVDADLTPCAASQIPVEPIELSDSSSDDEQENFDAMLAEILALPDQDLQACLETLCAIVDRIAADPANEKIRRLRFANEKFSQRVGRHNAATDILRLAGFEEDAGTAEQDNGLVFHGNPSNSKRFQRVRDALHGILDDMFPGGSREPIASATTSAPSLAQHTVVTARRISQAERIARLTEERLRDPRAFREKAKARGATNRVVTNIRLSSPAEKTRREARHFNLADIDRMRIDREIENMPSYAEEYRRMNQAAPARDYSTLVARSYDTELISREAVDLTNRYRASKGLVPVKWHEGIARIAAEHAEAMAAGRAPFSHDGFDARVRAFPVPHRGAGENLALNSGVAAVAQTAVDGWIKSPGHEKNLRGSWDLCGIGAARSPSGTWYLTQLFARSA